MPPLSPFNKSCLALAIAQTLSIQVAESATILVTSNLDDNGGGCTLREAITSINNVSIQPGCLVADGSLGTNDIINFYTSNTSITLDGSPLSITEDVVINGDGTTVDGDAASQVLYINTSVVTLNEMTITNGFEFSFVGYEFLYRGGGIVSSSNSSITLNNSTVSDNFGAIGGGILSFSNSRITLNNSTVSGNRLSLGGGGIRFLSTDSLTLNNSTVSGNSAARGGGIYSHYTSIVILNNSTVSGNSAANGGGIYSLETSSVTLNNSIVAGNIAANGAELGNYSSNPVTANGNNLFGHSGLNNSEAFVNFTPGDSDINATSNGDNIPIASILDTTLDNNGGATQTHALVASSPALDAANVTDCPPEDQRGEPRDIDFFIQIVTPDKKVAVINLDGECDIGSFEK